MMTNTFYHGDCLFVLKHDITPNSIDLIYLDPPFFTGKVQKGTSRWQPEAMEISYEDSRKFWGEETKQKAMRDKAPEWLKHIAIDRPDFASYLYYMMQRLQACHTVLSSKGTIYLHCDYRASHYLKMSMDEIFGFTNFRNELIWCYSGGGVPQKDFARKHYSIFRYSKTKDYVFNIDEIREQYSQEILSRPKSSYAEHSYKNNPGKMTIGWDLNPKGKHPDDWFYMPIVNPDADERVGYPTQKPTALLKRLIVASSKKDDVVLDPFCGCGTTIIAAHELNRRWIGIDINKTAYVTTKDREVQMPLGIKNEFTKANYVTRNLEEVLALNPNEFEKWVNEYYKATKPMPDKGVDGVTTDGVPIQTKTFEITRKWVDEFNSCIKYHQAVKQPCKKAIMVSSVGFDGSATKRQFEIKYSDKVDIEFITPEMMLQPDF